MEYAELRWFSRDFGKKLKLKAQLAFRPSIQKQLNRVAKNGDIAQLKEINEFYQGKLNELNPPSSTTKLAGRKTQKQKDILDLIVKSSEQGVKDLETKREDMLGSMHKQNKGLTNKIDKLMDKYSLNKTEENRQEQTVQKEEEQQKNNENTNTNDAKVQSGQEIPNAVLETWTTTNGNKVEYQHDATSNRYNIKNKDAGRDEISAMVEMLKEKGVKKVKLDTNTLTADQLAAFMASGMEITNMEDVEKAIEENKKQADNTVEISTMEKAAEAKVEESRGEDRWTVKDAMDLAFFAKDAEALKEKTAFKRLPPEAKEAVVSLHELYKDNEVPYNKKENAKKLLVGKISASHDKQFETKTSSSAGRVNTYTNTSTNGGKNQGR